MKTVLLFLALAVVSCSPAEQTKTVMSAKESSVFDNDFDIVTTHLQDTEYKNHTTTTDSVYNSDLTNIPVHFHWDSVAKKMTYSQSNSSYNAPYYGYKMSSTYEIQGDVLTFTTIDSLPEGVVKGIQIWDCSKIKYSQLRNVLTSDDPKNNDREMIYYAEKLY